MGGGVVAAVIAKWPPDATHKAAGYLLNTPNKNRFCSRTWPMWPVWNGTEDPKTATFTTETCSLPNFPTKEETTSCLANRRLFLLGNSIARQFACHAPLLLGHAGEAEDRKSQMKACPKEFGAGACSIDAPYNVSVRSHWFLYWNGRPRMPPRPDSRISPTWERDCCGDFGVKECLEKVVFNDAATRSSDLLVTNVGIIYTLLDPSNMQNVWQWRVEHLRAFIQALDELFKGTVIWMTGSKQASSSQDVFTKDPAFFFADERTRRLDLEIMPIVLAETNWTIYDNYYHINEPLAYTSGFLLIRYTILDVSPNLDGSTCWDTIVPPPRQHLIDRDLIDLERLCRMLEHNFSCTTLVMVTIVQLQCPYAEDCLLHRISPDRH
jgi:hypothetical protein